ncbi:tRNA lysidine(34) synthetase TilS [Arenimonas sp. MALMAid1274]|uniref:tRNA lysidine(34) synthetase TilS n=1 Tax=Arenimonas sp. MALMAid1274 TaxID=3411630 RepID=UPI003B9EE13D
MVLSLPPPPHPGPVAVAFSGGLDSTVLLHRLAADPAIRAQGLRALHVDHGLHPESAKWSEHCRLACAMRGVPFASRRVQVQEAGQGLEAAARDARHAAFAQWLQPGELVALAHHRDDQVETVLLRLLRGSGDGVEGMRDLRPFGQGWLWRPLLAVPRSELLDYARQRGLAWIEDPSNDSPRHDRNFLRHRVLPVLAERWPQAGAAIARSAQLLATRSDLLADEDQVRLAQVQGLDPACLSVPALMALSPPWRDRVLRAWVTNLDLPPLPGHALATLATDLLAADDSAQPEYHWSGAVMRRWRDLLHAGPPLPPLPEDWSASWDGRAPLGLPTGESLSLMPGLPFDAPCRVQARQGGERIRLPGRAHRTELRDLLQTLGIPPWQRRRLPLLFAPDGELLAAGDVALSATLVAWLDENQARLRLTAAFA